MTQKQIKALALQYAKTQICINSDLEEDLKYNIQTSDARKEYKEQIDNIADPIIHFLEWLLNNHLIVKKSEVLNLYKEMNDKINGIIVGDSVYEAISGNCSECAFFGCAEDLASICALRSDLLCAFKFSQELTDKLNGK